MDDECEDEAYCLPSLSWSWPAFAGSVCILIGRWCDALGSFWVEDMANMFGMLHNRKVDRDGQRDIAQDVLNDIKGL